ncbi:hypothetical protein FUSO7_02525, partial [Fusobacterium necrophorum BFTR-2]
DIQNQEENAKLFQGLEIEHSPYMAEQGKYPVVFLSFKDTKRNTWEEMISDIRFFISELFYSFRFLLENSNEFDIPVFKGIITKKSNMSELTNSLKILSRMLKEHYQQKVVILIDEYDTPIVSAYEHG